MTSYTWQSELHGLARGSSQTSFDEIEEDAKLIKDADERARFLMQFKPVAIEVYSDKTSYYVDGDMYAKVAAVRYEGNLLTDIPYEK